MAASTPAIPAPAPSTPAPTTPLGTDFILDALADEERRRDMGRRGRRRILEHFTVRSQEAAYRRLFDELTRSRATPAAAAARQVLSVGPNSPDGPQATP